MSTPSDVWHTMVRARPAVAAIPEARGVRLTPLQEEGAARADAVLRRYGGVVVADSVGMGKTYIALRLIERAHAEHRDAIIIAPATLRSKWQRALGSRKVDVAVISHARLHRHGVASALRHRLTGTQPLIVVDEAHQFRNHCTARYRALSCITAGAHVALLTATPVNNRLADLYWLLRLFLGDGDLRRAGVPDLRSALLRDRPGSTAAARRVVAQVVIRRTRADLHDDAGLEFRFPTRALPVAVQYDLEACYPLLPELPAILERLPLAPFNVLHYSGHASKRGTDALIRIGLVKRLESSTWAFKRSVERLLHFVELSADAAAAGGFLQPRDAGRGDPLQLSLTGLLARPLPPHTDRVRLLEDLALDCMLLRRLRDAASSPHDAKAQRLERLLGTIGAAPRVVFTQYAETAERLFERLRPFRVALLHGSRAQLVSGPVSRRAVLERFAPCAMGSRAPLDHERIDTLICTDVLSEGLDLQDAQHCISYDLPWNPVRLMQRVGRIDRMQSPHEQVFCWYFKPDRAVEALLHLLQRLRRKIRTIEGSVGPEAPVLARTRQRWHPTHRLHAVSNVWRRLSLIASQVASESDGDAAIAACVRSARITGRVALLSVRAEYYGWWEAVPLDRVPKGAFGERRIASLLLELHDEGLLAGDCDDIRAAARLTLARRRRCVSGPRTSSRNEPCRMAALEIRRRLGCIPGGASQRDCDAAERVLLRFRNGLPIAQERALAALMQTAADLDLATLLGRIEALLSGRRRHALTPRITAILIVEGINPG